jgi:hypothetical protein
MEDLYRHFDAYGNLLYVGRSLSAIARLQRHSHDAHWSDNIASMTIEKVPAEKIKDYEIECIKKEKPLHNKMHNTPRKKRKKTFNDMLRSLRPDEKMRLAKQLERETGCTFSSDEEAFDIIDKGIEGYIELKRELRRERQL